MDNSIKRNLAANQVDEEGNRCVREFLCEGDSDARLPYPREQSRERFEDIEEVGSHSKYYRSTDID